jgi:mannose-1-phosphate guanylyltransferase
VETLLAETRRRIAIGVSAPRTFFSVTYTHERFYAPLLADVWSRRVVVQPRNRGTAPAILYALLRVAAVGLLDPVAIVPSDHYVSDDVAFMAHVGAAFDLVAVRPDLITLLGVTPDRPETEYGWIEPAEPVVGPRGWPAYRVRRFWEKPTLDLARTLLQAGALWNSFVMVGRVASLLGLVRRTLPDLTYALLPLRRVLGTRAEAEVARAVYDRLSVTDFSRDVLTPTTEHLVVLPVRGVGWSDLGSPDRVREIRRSMATSREAAAGALGLVPTPAR